VILINRGGVYSPPKILNQWEVDKTTKYIYTDIHERIWMYLYTCIHIHTYVYVYIYREMYIYT